MPADQGSSRLGAGSGAKRSVLSGPSVESSKSPQLTRAAPDDDSPRSEQPLGLGTRNIVNGGSISRDYLGIDYTIPPWELRFKHAHQIVLNAREEQLKRDDQRNKELEDKYRRHQQILAERAAKTARQVARKNERFLNKMERLLARKREERSEREALLKAHEEAQRQHQEAHVAVLAKQNAEFEKNLAENHAKADALYSKRQSELIAEREARDDRSRASRAQVEEQKRVRRAHWMSTYQQRLIASLKTKTANLNSKSEKAIEKLRAAEMVQTTDKVKMIHAACVKARDAEDGPEETLAAGEYWNARKLRFVEQFPNADKKTRLLQQFLQSKPHMI